MKRAVIAAWCLVYLNASAVMAADATKFDLHCTGTNTKVGGNSPPSPWWNWFKIDLDTMEYCSVGCQSEPAVEPIKSVTSETIVLTDTDDSIQQIGFASINKITLNRVTGQVRWENVIGSVHTIAQGACTPGPFTGFPPKKF